MVTDVNWTYCGDHFIMYKNIKSLYCTPETNIILYVKYNLIKNKLKPYVKKKKKELKTSEQLSLSALMTPKSQYGR